MSRSPHARHTLAAIGALLLATLALAPVRDLLEAGMERHMLLQYPLLMLAGALLGGIVPRPLARALSAWNAMGLAGLAAAMLSLGVLMIPRVLDLALTDPAVEAAKFAVLVLVGAVLGPSWRDAGPVVQAFCMGVFLPMTVAVGALYQDAPLRLCNAYRLDEQQDLGLHLILVAIALAALWLGRTARAVVAVGSVCR